MDRESSTLSLLWTDGKEGILAHKGISMFVVGLVVLALAVVAVFVVTSVVEPAVAPDTATGVEAGSVPSCAEAAHDAPDSGSTGAEASVTGRDSLDSGWEPDY